MIQRYWGSDRFYHHTAPISMNYALREALALVAKEGLEARIARHALNGRALHAGLAAMYLTLATVPGHRLPQLTCVLIPEGIDDLAVRRRLLKDWGIEIGGGPRAVQGESLANRSDGAQLAPEQCHPGSLGARDLPARPGL